MGRALATLLALAMLALLAIGVFILVHVARWIETL